MNWRLADAKNRFSELVTKALIVGPQRVRIHDQAVIVLSEDDYNWLVGRHPKGLFAQRPRSAWHRSPARSRSHAGYRVMRVLLDICVIPELRRTKSDTGVQRRVAELESNSLFLSVITLREFTKGIALLSEGRQRRDLALWLLGLEHQFAEQILPVDHEVARIWREIVANAQTKGVQIPVSAGLIAATAIHHGLHVMTQNTRHVYASGALIIDPWQG